jgi:hypothetical protein
MSLLMVAIAVDPKDQLVYVTFHWHREKETVTMVMFIRLIIRLFQLVFSVRTIFFSYNKSANSIFQSGYQHSRTEPIWLWFMRLLQLHVLDNSGYV